MRGNPACRLLKRIQTPIGNNQIVSDAFGFLKLTQPGIFQDFAPELSDLEKNILLATQIPTSLNSIAAPLPVAPAWKTKPNWFIVASHDRVISPQLEQSEAQRMNAITLTLPACHVVMLEHPFPVADFIEDAAERLSH